MTASTAIHAPHGHHTDEPDPEAQRVPVMLLMIWLGILALVFAAIVV